MSAVVGATRKLGARDRGERKRSGEAQRSHGKQKPRAGACTWPNHSLFVVEKLAEKLGEKLVGKQAEKQVEKQVEK